MAAAILFTPVPGSALEWGCADAQLVTVGIGAQEPGDLGIYSGTATKINSGFTEDTFEFTATDPSSGKVITGTYTVTTGDCLVQAVTGLPVAATLQTYEFVQPTPES